MDKKKRLRKECDKLLKEVIIKKYGRCEVCGQTFGITAHHIFPRSSYGHLRYDIDNSACLCMGCHFAHHTKAEPLIHHTIISKRGQKWFNSLKAKSLKRPQSYQTIGYYTDTLKTLKNLSNSHLEQ